MQHHQYSYPILISQRQNTYNLDQSQKILVVNQPVSSLTINGSSNQIIINARIHNILINGNYNVFTTQNNSQASSSCLLNNVIFNGQKNNLQCRPPLSFSYIVNGMGNKINGRVINPGYQQQNGNHNVYNSFDRSSFNININNNSFQSQSSFSNVSDQVSSQVSSLLNMVFSNINNPNNSIRHVQYNSAQYNNNNNYDNSEDDEYYEDEEGEYEEFEDEEEVRRVNMHNKVRENVILNFDEFQFKHANKYIKHIEDSCAICLEKFLKTDIVKRFACGDHIFHKKCLAKWLKKSDLCPLCKFNLTNLVGKPEYQGEEEE
jgi:hypothetical protein